MDTKEVWSPPEQLRCTVPAGCQSWTPQGSEWSSPRCSDLRKIVKEPFLIGLFSGLSEAEVGAGGVLPFLCRLVQELRPLSDLQGKISAVRTRRELISFKVFSRFLRAQTHANAPEAISAIGLWEPQRTVYYISEKEHVILGHSQKIKK